jgi:hypothetical protein
MHRGVGATGRLALPVDALPGRQILLDPLCLALAGSERLVAAY